jgi:hypothetical protein
MERRKAAASWPALSTADVATAAAARRDSVAPPSSSSCMADVIGTGVSAIGMACAGAAIMAAAGRSVRPACTAERLVPATMLLCAETMAPPWPSSAS